MVNIKKKHKKEGRPTKYRPIFAKKLLEYCNKKPNELVEVKFVNGFGIPITKKILVPNELPTLEEFSIDNHLAEDTLLDWAQATKKNGEPKYPEFSAAYKHLKVTQKRFLVSNGLNGLYKEKFAIFVAQNFTPMREKIEHLSDPENPLKVEVVDYSNAVDLSKRKIPAAV